MKHFYFLLAAIFVCHLYVGASPINDDPEPPPIQVEINPSKGKDVGRTLVIESLECWYYPTTKSFLFSSFTIISNVEISIRNVTTGELFEEEYPVFAGQVCLPVTGSKGLYIIEVIINSNETFIGEIRL